MVSGSGLYLDKQGEGRGREGVHDRHFSANPTPPFEEPAFNLPPSPPTHVNIVKSCKLLSTSQRLEIYKIWPAAIPLSLRPNEEKKWNLVYMNGNRSVDIFLQLGDEDGNFPFFRERKEKSD